MNYSEYAVLMYLNRSFKNQVFMLIRIAMTPCIHSILVITWYMTNLNAKWSWWGRTLFTLNWNCAKKVGWMVLEGWYDNMFVRFLTASRVSWPSVLSLLSYIMWKFAVLYYVKALLVNDRDRVLWMKKWYLYGSDLQGGLENCKYRDLIILVWSNSRGVHEYRWTILSLLNKLDDDLGYIIWMIRQYVCILFSCNNKGLIVKKISQGGVTLINNFDL